MNPHEIITLVAFFSSISFFIGAENGNSEEAEGFFGFMSIIAILSATVAITLRFVK